MLYFYHLLFTKNHVFLVLHKTANVPGLCSEKLRIYDQKDVDSSALKCSWMLHHRTSSRKANSPSQPTAGQQAHPNSPLICCHKAPIPFLSTISIFQHCRADVSITFWYPSLTCVWMLVCPHSCSLKSEFKGLEKWPRPQAALQSITSNFFVLLSGTQQHTLGIWLMWMIGL